MIEIVEIGETVPIRILLWDGSAILTGKTVVVSIERLSDGKFWNGSSFPDTTYRTVSMTEQSGNVHVEGVYQYSFAHPTADSVEGYDWGVKYNTGGVLAYWKGRIWTVPTEVLLADALLKRDWNSVSGEAARSLLNAVRLLRNKVSESGGTLTVTKEDDTATAWTAAVTTSETAKPIVTIDPT